MWSIPWPRIFFRQTTCLKCFSSQTLTTHTAFACLWTVSRRCLWPESQLRDTPASVLVHLDPCRTLNGGRLCFEASCVNSWYQSCFAWCRKPFSSLRLDEERTFAKQTKQARRPRVPFPPSPHDKKRGDERGSVAFSSGLSCKVLQ